MDWTSKDKTVTLLHGDCLERLRDIQTGSVHCCLSSPPYFALRQYLPRDHPDKDREIGSEPTPEAFIATMVAVFREVRRVLRDDGFLWVNLGDSYSVGGKWANGNSTSPKHAAGAVSFLPRQDDGTTPGNQLLMPHRVALALQADGWVLRDTVIWSKRSPMPSSQNGVRWEKCRVKVETGDYTADNKVGALGVHPGRDTPGSTNRPVGSFNDDGAKPKWSPCHGCSKCIPNGGYVLRRGQGRTTTAHEYLFLFTKGNSYHWDMENCREPQAESSKQRFGKNASMNCGRGRKASQAEQGNTMANSDYKSHLTNGLIGSRIPRSVWTLSSEPTKFNHFATYPSELVRRCLMPLSPRGCCPECGAQWAPVIEMPDTPARQDYEGKNLAADPQHSSRRMLSAVRAARNNGQPHDNPFQAPRVIGYRPTCDCEPHEPAGCLVLDPFSGTGTTGQTARFLGHRYIGIELNEKYLEHAKAWIFQAPRWHLRDQVKATKKPKPLTNQRPLAFMDQS